MSGMVEMNGTNMHDSHRPGNSIVSTKKMTHCIYSDMNLKG